jgi:molybdate transport system substrate-binding protein
MFAILFTSCSGNTVSNKPGGSDASVKNEVNSSGEPVELNVWAATGIKKAILEIAPAFEKENGVKMVFNFASSGDLQTQIEQGAPADLFISAGKKQIKALDEKQLLIKDSIKNLAGNDLVIAAPQNSNLTINKLEELATLGADKKIAMGNPDQVPAGKYAIQSLQKAGIWEKVQPKVIYAKDVRQISSYIDSGNVDIGVFYKSDLKVGKNVKTLLLVPDSYHDPIIFTGAVVKSGKQQALASKFISFVLSDRAQQILKDNGFNSISK